MIPTNVVGVQIMSDQKILSTYFRTFLLEEKVLCCGVR